MTTVVMIEQILVQGLLTGAVFALLALGFTLLYSVAGVINFAHGALLMLGAYTFFILTVGHFRFDPTLALFLATIFIALAGTIVYALSIHPVIGDPLAPLVTTIGVALVIQQVVLIMFGPTPRPISVPTFARGSTNFLGTTVLHSQLLSFAASLVLFTVILTFVAKTKIGKAMRAVAQDREVAMLIGVNTPRLYILTIAISTALSVIAGLLIGFSTTRVADPFMWNYPLVLSFAIVIIGGLGSMKGSFIGGFIIGYIEIAIVYSVPGGSYLKGGAALAVMVAILLIRPKGLFGKRIELE